MRGDAFGRGVCDALAAVSAASCQPASTQRAMLMVTRDAMEEIALTLMKVKMKLTRKMTMKTVMKQKKQKKQKKQLCENHEFRRPGCLAKAAQTAGRLLARSASRQSPGRVELSWKTYAGSRILFGVFVGADTIIDVGGY